MVCSNESKFSFLTHSDIVCCFHSTARYQLKGNGACFHKR